MCGIVKSMPATYLNRTQREWSQFLGATQHAINSAYQTSNRWSPAFLMFGRHFRLPIEKLLSAEPSPNSGELEDLGTILRERQADAITEVIVNQKDARKRQRELYNRRAREKGFEVGDLVYVYTPSVKPGNARKLTAKWLPGYVVEGKRSNDLTYDVRKPGSHKPPEKVYVNRLKPCPQSQVYRTAGKAGRVLGTGRAMRTAQALRRSIDDERGTEGDTDGETTDGDPAIVFPRTFRDSGLPGTVTSGGESSGVTTVLEAAATGARCRDSDDSSSGPEPHEVLGD